MMCRASGVVGLVAVVLLAGSAHAESMQLKPGKWKFESSTVMSMSPQPQTSTETKCITEEVAKQDPLAEMVEKGNCKVLSRSEDGDTLNFEIECAGDERTKMKSRGKGTFTSSGDKASGTMSLAVEMPEMANMPGAGGKMTMEQKWTGERLGACD